MKEKMDFMLHCNGLEIHVSINTAANIYQECIDDVVNDLCNVISNNLGKYSTISNSDVGDPWKEKEKYLDYVNSSYAILICTTRVSNEGSNINGTDDTLQMIVSFISRQGKKH